ncbi:hypothetical protein [Nocardia sp. NRRL S-836]|uniref:hypothetical protein n=1 Tax=Nocardia sp. NRRL S-836 TaxID=1519492 RepID=UPI0006AF74BC|nr:hypothetical protein [Nocardia sp. NRRL S-836]KOV89677.1 hypothetical protein ADL03_02255 [Nocardia sp. NRRL S-836]
MPRKPAGTVRAQFPPLPHRLDAADDVPGVSPSTRREIRKLEFAHERLYRGAVRNWLWKWRIEACGPPCREEDDGSCRGPYEHDDDGHWEREDLEDVLRLLPAPAARDLRRVVERIDNHHRSGCPGWRDCRWRRRGRTPPTWWRN